MKKKIVFLFLLLLISKNPLSAQDSEIFNFKESLMEKSDTVAQTFNGEVDITNEQSSFTENGRTHSIYDTTEE